MARHFQHGHFNAFFWAQPYGGTIDQALAAVAFTVTRPSVLALKSVPMALDGVVALLTWRVGRRVIGAQPAIVAALIVWVWPGAYVWWSTAERGFYEACLALNLAIVLIAVRIAQGRDRPASVQTRDWVLLGLAGGLAWWEGPESAYVLIPVAVWLLIVHRGAVNRAVVALPAFVLGALPWLWWNASHHFSSLTPQASVLAVPGSYAGHLGTFFEAGLPTALGLRAAVRQDWLGGWWHLVLYAGLVALLAVGVLRSWPGGQIVAILVVAFPFLHAYLPNSGYVGDGRYLYFLLPWLALLLAAAARGTLPSAVLGAVLVAITVGGLLDIRGATRQVADGKPVPDSISALQGALTANHVDRAWANYWIAYRVTFETDERVIVAPPTAQRYPPYAAEVASSVDPAHIFVTGTSAQRAFEAGLRQRGIAYRVVPAGGFTMYLTATKVGPTTIPGSYP